MFHSYLRLDLRQELGMAVGEGVTEKANELLPDGIMNLWTYALQDSFSS